MDRTPRHSVERRLNDFAQVITWDFPTFWGKRKDFVSLFDAQHQAEPSPPATLIALFRAPLQPTSLLHAADYPRQLCDQSRPAVRPFSSRDVQPTNQSCRPFAAVLLSSTLIPVRESSQYACARVYVPRVGKFSHSGFCFKFASDRSRAFSFSTCSSRRAHSNPSEKVKFLRFWFSLISSFS